MRVIVRMREWKIERHQIVFPFSYPPLTRIDVSGRCLFCGIGEYTWGPKFFEI